MMLWGDMDYSWWRGMESQWWRGMESTSSYCLGLVMAALVGIYWLTSRPRRPRYPPGPPGLPIYGNLWALQRANQAGPSMLTSWGRQYGDVYAVRMGAYDAVVLSSSHVIREAFVKQSAHTGGRATNVFFVRHVIGKIGLLANDGPEWYATRRAAVRSMRDAGLGKRHLEQDIQDEAHWLVDVLGRQGDAPCSLKMMFNKIVCNVVCSIVFGHRYDHGDAELERVASQLNYMFKYGGYCKEMFSPVLTLLMPLLNVKLFKASRIYLQLRTFIQNKIREHKKAFDPNNIKSFVDLYLKAEMEGELSNTKLDTHLLVTVLDVFMAGVETTSIALRWAVLYFINYPHVQERCQREVQQVVGSKQMPSMDDRPGLVYTEATLLELQRITSIAAYGLLHRTTAPITIAGYSIPKDVLLIPNLHGVHMDAEYWGDPETFRPERWISEGGTLLRHEAFLPFSIGPRECPGRRLASQQIFLTVAALLQKYTFRAPDPARPPPLTGYMGATYSPTDYHVIVTPL